MNISRWIDAWAEREPGKIAIRFQVSEISYAAFAADIAATAAALQELGANHGDRIAYLGYNRPEFLSVLFACARLGAIVVPLNYRLAPAEHLFMVTNADATVLIYDPQFEATAKLIAGEVGRCRPVPVAVAAADGSEVSLARMKRAAAVEIATDSPSSDSPLLLVYTSGTTGRPKGAVLTQRALHWNALASQGMHDLCRDDHVLSALPFFHVGGLNIQTTPALYTGATVTLLESFDAAGFLRTVEADKPTLTVLVPTQMQAIAQEPRWHDADLSSLRCVTTGSTMVPCSLIDIWHEHGVPVVQVYGCTESGPVSIHQTPATAHTSVGSIGRPAQYCEVRVVDAAGEDVQDGQHGELLLRGPNLLHEYWRDPDATQRSLRAGWFHTGDMGYRESNGDYFIVDRKKHVIISGGENIYPSELERILLEHPRIAEAAVVGYSDEKWGEVPAAAVVSTDVGTALDPAILASLFDGRLGRLKHPRHYVFLDALPKNAMGKVIHAAVKAEIEKRINQS